MFTDGKLFASRFRETSLWLKLLMGVLSSCSLDDGQFSLAVAGRRESDPLCIRLEDVGGTSRDLAVKRSQLML